MRTMHRVRLCLLLVAGLVLVTLTLVLGTAGEATQDPTAPVTIESGPLTFTERKILERFAKAWHTHNDPGTSR